MIRGDKAGCRSIPAVGVETKGDDDDEDDSMNNNRRRRGELPGRKDRTKKKAEEEENVRGYTAERTAADAADTQESRKVNVRVKTITVLCD